MDADGKLIPERGTEAAQASRGLEKLVTEKIAPLVVALCSYARAHATSRIFGVRNNEIYLFGQARSTRTAHTNEGWTREAIAERVFDHFANDFSPLQKSGDVFT